MPCFFQRAMRCHVVPVDCNATLPILLPLRSATVWYGLSAFTQMAPPSRPAGERSAVDRTTSCSPRAWARGIDITAFIITS